LTSKSKKSQPMGPSKALTARCVFAYFHLRFSYVEIRNLFAIDYLKDHPDTTSADFKKVFDSIDEATRKVFVEFIISIVTN
jgi:hypothetical protein